MFDESILELEEIEGEDRWHPSVVEARYKTYRDAKAWELAMTMARVLAEGMPDKLEWLKNQADAMTECGDPSGALQLLKEASERFEEDGKYLLAVGRQYSLLCEIDEAIPFADTKFRKVEESIGIEWVELIQGLLSRYWRTPEGQWIEVEMSTEAIQASVDFQNEIVREQESLDWLGDMPQRWRENAFRFALILHVSMYPNMPERHFLDADTMRNAILIMRWFIGREIASLGCVKASDPAIGECKAKVFKFLQDNGPATIRDLERKKFLKKGFVGWIYEWVRSGELVMWNASKGIRPSPTLCIPGDDRIPTDKPMITTPL